MQIICLLEIMWIEVKILLNLLFFCWLTRYVIHKISFYSEATMNVEVLIEFMDSMMNVLFYKSRQEEIQLEDMEIFFRCV